MQIRELSRDLWVVDTRIEVAGMPLGIRMTVIRRPQGSLILHSPVEIDDRLAGLLEELGPIADIIAPSRMHHLFVFGADRRWPEATTWAAPGLPAKRRDLVFDAVLGAHTPEALADTLDMRLLAGCPLASEVMCLHRASRTLIVTDLVFNIHETSSLASQLYLRASGAWQRCAQTPLMRALIRDRPAARRSLEQVLSWDFDRLIMAHGEVIESGARPLLREALAPLMRT